MNNLHSFIKLNSTISRGATFYCPLSFFPTDDGNRIIVCIHHVNVSSMSVQVSLISIAVWIFCEGLQFHMQLSAPFCFSCMLSNNVKSGGNVNGPVNFIDIASFHIQRDERNRSFNLVKL